MKTFDIKFIGYPEFKIDNTRRVTVNSKTYLPEEITGLGSEKFKFRFLNSIIFLYENVTFLVKTKDELLAEGWEIINNKLSHPNHTIKMGVDKQKTCGQVLKGKVVCNSVDSEVVILTNNHWRYPEDMIKLIVPEEKYKPYALDFGRLKILFKTTGEIELTDVLDLFNDKIILNHEETNKLLKQLLIHQNMIKG